MTTTETVIKKEKERENSRKRSAEDRDIDEWAKKLLTRAVPQIPIPGQSNGGTALSDLPLHAGFDIDSAIGRFQWVVIGREKFIPCIFRNGIKYCCVRMVESAVMGELLNVLPQEIYHSAKLCSHFATQAEAKLLTYINQWHCDSLYGSVPFTEKDLVVTLQEVEEFYEYLTFAYNVLASGGQNKASDFSRCGFVKVNNESLIPYTVLRSESGGSEKGVPLFYFEGQTDILKAKAKMLTGWDLAYLKVCCKVQGVRKELIAGDELNIVKLSDLKSYFPKRTQFTENCWPPGKGKSLLPKQNLNGVLHAQQLARNAVQANNSDKMATSMSTTNPSTFVQGPARIVNNNNAAVYAVNNVRRDINVNINGVQVNRSAPVVNTYGRPVTTAVSASVLQKIKAIDPLILSPKILSIPEGPDGARPGAFQLSAVQLDGNTIHCINYKAFHQEPRLVLLPHYVQTLYPGLPINQIVVPKITQMLNIPVYLPSTSQIRALNQNGYSIIQSSEMPLVYIKEFEPRLPQLKRHLVDEYMKLRTVQSGNNVQFVTNNPHTARVAYAAARR